MIYKIIFSPKFVNDLNETFDYISSTLSSEKAAKNLMKKIDSSILLLKQNPYMFPLCSEPLDVLNYRKIVIKNYIAVYQIDDNAREVNLLRLFYGRCDYLKSFL